MPRFPKRGLPGRVLPSSSSDELRLADWRED